MAKIWVLQHHPVEDLGTIAEALAGARLGWQYVRGFEGAPVPRDMKGAGGLVVMGGPMGVYETNKYPFLRDEIALIEDALKENRPIVGVCLGSQLLAAALGARVAPGAKKEIGWHRVRLESAASGDRLVSALPESFNAFHWHGDSFDLPAGALWLASSESTRYQAFRYGENAYGLLFHLEVTGDSVEAMARAFAGELKEEGIPAGSLTAGRDEDFSELKRLAESVFARWAGPIQGT